jgi:hypothetical protein
MAMSKMIDSLSRMVHEASTSFIDNQVVATASEAVTGLVTTSFEVLEKLLVVVRDLSAPTEEETP